MIIGAFEYDKLAAGSWHSRWPVDGILGQHRSRAPLGSHPRETVRRLGQADGSVGGNRSMESAFL
jgi:hypothetical protein